MAVKRLDRLLSELGVATRSELRQMIKSGRVTVDGAAAVQPDMKIEEQGHTICVDGVELCTSCLRYFMMDKPEGVLSATEDKRQETVLDILPPDIRRIGLFPVGRLDKDTTGLLLVTDDGDYVHRVITPKKHVPKVYFARTDGQPTNADAERFAQGVILGDGTQCLPARLERLPEQGGCRVTVYEGKYHMVKRMLAGCGTPVLQLHRLSIGALTLDPALSPGAYRELSPDEAMLVFSLPTS